MLAGALPGPALAGVTEPPRRCARTADDPPGLPPPEPAPFHPCWVEVEPYPFGHEGYPISSDPADPSYPNCFTEGRGANRGCHLGVTSLDFRSWNRGLAKAGGIFGVWIYNGIRWLPDPTYPGAATCPGDKIRWAGKRDYWIIGSTTLCRFDGFNFEWQQLRLPQATRDRSPSSVITDGGCAAWNDCMFFGGDGVVVRWDGATLRDASIGAPATAPDFAAASLGASSPLAAVVADAPPPPRVTPPDQLFFVQAGPPTPTPFAVPARPVGDDLYRTDLVAVDLGPDSGWAAGNPASRLQFSFLELATGPEPRGRTSADTEADYSPLLPVQPPGGQSCAGPEPDAFTYLSRATPIEDYLWSTISALGDASGFGAVGGAGRPEGAGWKEPVLVELRCGAEPVVRTFRVPHPLDPEAPPIAANRNGSVTSVVVTAPNEAWAVTRESRFGPSDTPYVQQPRLYRYTDTLPPLAPPGDDAEERPIPREPDPPIFEFPPQPPEPPPPPPAPVTTTPRRLGPAIDRVRVKRVRTRLLVTFRVRRPITVAVVGLRKKRVVAQTRYRRYTKPVAKTRLILKAKKRRWPTRLQFRLREPPTPPPPPEPAPAP